MSLSESEWRALAEAALEELESSFSRLAVKYDLDDEIAEGVLKITFEEPEHSVFVVSSNAPARQIWVSALLSSYKFDWNEETNQWVLHGGSELLKQVMQRLTREQLGDESVSL
jgi:iron donor protein CyaY